MARQRKTIDTFEIHVNYGYGDGWEHEVTEFTRFAARQAKKAYQDNTPYRIKIVNRRVPKDSFTPDELSRIEQQIAEGREGERQARLKRLQEQRAKMDPMIAWSQRYDVTVDDARKLRRLVNTYAYQSERSLNGDPHPSNPDFATDKNANLEAWDRAADGTARRLRVLAGSLGFRVDFGVGLYPALSKGQEDSIFLPQNQD